MKRLPRALLLAAGLLPAAYAQFELSVVVGGAELPVASFYDFGNVASGDQASAHFRLRNTSDATATLTVLAAAGIGFTLSGAPTLPATVISQAAVDFTVGFTALLPASYSAIFSADGVSAELGAVVVAGLTFQVEIGAGKISLGSRVDFGSAPVGQAAIVHFDISNQTGLALPIPAFALTSGDFAFSGAVPASVLAPGQGSGFAVQFLPTAAGPRNATLTIGALAYGLTGAGIAVVLPTPQITIHLPQPQSAQQGSVRVTFGSPAASSGSGTLTLVFQPAVAGETDPTIAFLFGGLTATFTFSAGDTQGSFGGQPEAAFQTGTTAGTLVWAVQLGGASVEQNVVIAPALVGITTAGATRSAGSVTVQLDGFDNTRTAAALTFSFFDATGAPIAGPIDADGGPAFQTYFGGSNTGGDFALQAVFPVTGDPARIASFAASIANQAGTTTTARTPF
jgi:hypothetical protein